ncbi:MAG: nucleotidyl transferase AbiEii/AbiGii toxin family protein [Deltaproteobacteria bacterium]|nr:nucleotidyl transferase AbiEii/AbiGii toxin family protein [Deltaproteobacteria bacterium]
MAITKRKAILFDGRCCRPVRYYEGFGPRILQPEAVWFSELQKYLGLFYEIRDAAEKFHRLVIELKSADYPRSLKLEMRKGAKIARTDRAIAYSRFSTAQVYLRIVPLPEMMASKIEALLQRKEIRDAYDIEFLIKKGVKTDVPPEKAVRILAVIDALTRQDYDVKLSSLLEADQRVYYRQNNFVILKDALGKKGGQLPINLTGNVPEIRVD